MFMRRKMVKNVSLGTKISFGKYAIKNYIVLDVTFGPIDIYSIGFLHSDGSYHHCFSCEGERFVWL